MNEIIEKLRILLPHWLAHNHSHAEEYRQWAAKLRDNNSDEIAGLIEEAVNLTRKADQALALALDKAGGPATGHKHHHHH